MSRTLVVTGCSGGFGLVIAQEAVRQGFRVLGSVRRDADAEGLRAAGCAVGILDLCDEASCIAFAELAAEWCGGRLDAVVHNAGTAFPAPMVGADRSDLRAQFEVNTIGQIHFNGLLMPSLIAAKGRAVFISSISAVMPTALLGPYAASKRALEAMAESLAMEVKALGVSVCVVRPGSYSTGIWDTSVQRGDKYLELDLGEPLTGHYRRLGEKVRRVALSQPLSDPLGLGRFVLRVLTARRSAFYRTTPISARTMQTLCWLLPTRWFHALIRFVLGRS